MKLAVSNIALSPYDHREELKHLPEMGLTGLEVAPSRVWRDTWKGLTSADVTTYRNQVEQAGLSVIGFHSLLYDQPELGLFRDPQTRSQTLDFMEHLSKLCRDLGGKTLTYGGGRHRREMSLEHAFTEAVAFFEDLIPRIEDHQTAFCFEPLPPEDSDFINSVYESIRVVKTVNHPSLRVQLDAKALFAVDEMNPEVFEAAAPYLVHAHTNEPGFEVLGTSGKIDNARMAELLRGIGYDGYIAIEQKMIGAENPLESLARSAEVLRQFYA